MITATKRGGIVHPAAQYSSDQYNFQARLQERLSTAHARIEKAFLDGGETLVSVMELVNAMIGTLDRFSRSLDGETATVTIGGMTKAIDDLGSLPATASARQQSFLDIGDICAGAISHVDDMRETFRYLKVFATTVKITGAGLSEFAEFAEEIRNRIHSGADEINRFSAELDRMRQELDGASKVSHGILSEFGATVPALAANLSHNAGRMTKEYEVMAALAREVKAVAGEVQQKIAQTLSALQIGDITRQRIEHVKTSIDYLEAFLEEPEGRALASAERAALEAAVSSMLQAQLDQTLVEFRDKCAQIFATISSFSGAAAQILSLRTNLVGSRDGADERALALMARDLGLALDLTAKVQDRSAESARLAHSVGHSVQALIASIETLRGIKTDIHYMALNSNLRCSRLGDAGRSVNVVSGELRTFAARLEAPADAVVDSMRRISMAADALTGSSGTGLMNLGAPLAAAQAAVAEAATEMDEGMQALDEQGNAVFGRIAAAVRSLDFEQALGALLADCVDIATDMAAGQPEVPSADVAGALSARIHAIYTMAEEREIHRRFLPLPAGSDITTGSVAMAGDDDDFLDDALF